MARAAALDQLCIDLSAFHLDNALAGPDAGIAIRCHADDPAAMEQARLGKLASEKDLLVWLADGLIDTLPGNDVNWCAAIVAVAMARPVTG